MKLKDILQNKLILSENTPGYKNRKFGDPLPTLAGIKKAYQAKQGKINEEYVESMNSHELANLLGKIGTLWTDWKKGPLTEPSDIKPAQKELKGWITRWMKQNIK